jgi:RNA polymerase-binding transcription factor DksA
VDYDERNGWRARQREVLKCVTCGAPIEGARRRDTKLCAACKHASRLEINRRHRQRAKAGATGRRGSNQFKTRD